MQEKYEEILNVIRQFDKVGVCLSGGADSSLVAIAAVDALGKWRFQASYAAALESAI